MFLYTAYINYYILSDVCVCITMILVLLFDPFVCIGCGGATNEKGMLPLLSV